jgi:hypothetical protein
LQLRFQVRPGLLANIRWSTKPVVNDLSRTMTNPRERDHDAWQFGPWHRLLSAGSWETGGTKPPHVGKAARATFVWSGTTTLAAPQAMV